MKNLYSYLLALISVLVYLTFSGCSSAKLDVDEKLSSTYKTDNLKIIDKTSLKKEKNYQKEFAELLTKELYDSLHFKKGNQLTLEYKITHLDPGSQLLRYFIGFGLGAGDLSVELNFLDSAGKNLSKIHVTNRVSGGFIGGDFSDCIYEVVDKIIDYVNSNFFIKRHVSNK